MTSLKIVTNLATADEFADATVEIVAGDVQAAAGPAPAKVRAYVKSLPVIGRLCDQNFGREGFGGQVGRKRRRAEQSNGCHASKNIFLHERPRGI